MAYQPSEKFMQMAIDKTREGVLSGQTPFGACIVKDGKVVACEHNTVWQDTDITSHGEVHTIRAACKAIGSIDLSGCILYSTCEPCPMCFSAIHWARIDTVVYGAFIADAQDAGFNELTISNEKMKEFGGSPVNFISGFMRDENVALFKLWKEQGANNVY
ncbi:tRNA-specific adenosine deaminase [Candidatus Peregrinibacteria bacterium CG2_30_44_17]|nr:MAG: tRNA-specific adenosine deaminase [Candidatus Peregrinibacteria bacterium CG2_30_44_17]